MEVKILIDGRWLRSGKRGIGVFTHALLVSLTQISCDDLHVTVALPASSIADFQCEFGDVFTVISLPEIPDPLLDFFYFSLISYKFNLVHFTGNTGMLLGRFNCKVLLTVHDVSFMKSSVVVPWPHELRQVIGRIYRKLAVPICSNRADRLVTVSKFAAQDLMLELNLTKVPSFVYHGINDTLLCDETAISAVDVVRDKYLVIGGSDPQKNIRCVVQAFTSLYEKYALNAPEIIIIGLTAKDFSRCNFSSYVSPNISFFGYLNHSQVHAAIKLAKCIIVPSFYESFGLPVIESLSNRTPVICSNRGALKEIGGDAPIYFDPSLPSSLVDAINQVEQFPDRSKQINDWLANSSERFNWHKCAEHYIQIYRELTGLR